jgi:hypothetical protein
MNLSRSALFEKMTGKILPLMIDRNVGSTKKVLPLSEKTKALDIAVSSHSDEDDLYVIILSSGEHITTRGKYFCPTTKDEIFGNVCI